MPSGIILLQVHNFINPQAVTSSRNGPCRFSIVCDNICIPVLPGKPSLDKTRAMHLQIGSVSSSNASFSYFIQQLNVDGPDVASHQLVLKVLAWHLQGILFNYQRQGVIVCLAKTSQTGCSLQVVKTLTFSGASKPQVKRVIDSNCMLGAHLHVLHNR